jgi:hypothetical protein
LFFSAARSLSVVRFDGAQADVLSRPSRGWSPLAPVGAGRNRFAMEASLTKVLGITP